MKDTFSLESDVEALQKKSEKEAVRVLTSRAYRFDESVASSPGFERSMHADADDNDDDDEEEEDTSVVSLLMYLLVGTKSVFVCMHVVVILFYFL